MIYRYDHERGVRDSVISDFRIMFVGVDFRGVEGSRYADLSAEIGSCRRALVAEYPFLDNATPFIGAIKSLAARDDDVTARTFLALTAQRRRLLYGAGERIAFALWLAERRYLHTKRTLIFHETIADCEFLARELQERGVSALAHHSELNSDERNLALARFARGDIHALIAPRTLDEGIDVPDASLAIIVAGTRVKRQTIQRIGRVLRLGRDKAPARVVKVFVRGCADDPTLGTADQFSLSLVSSGRAVVADWPAASDAIDAFLSDR